MLYVNESFFLLSQARGLGTDGVNAERTRRMFLRPLIDALAVKEMSASQPPLPVGSACLLLVAQTFRHARQADRTGLSGADSRRAPTWGAHRHHLTMRRRC